MEINSGKSKTLKTHLIRLKFKILTQLPLNKTLNLSNKRIQNCLIIGNIIKNYFIICVLN